MNATGCHYIYDLTQCEKDPEEDNYEDYTMLDATRAAMHVGNRALFVFRVTLISVNSDSTR